MFISYDQVDVSNLAGVEQIVRRIIQDERAVRMNPKHPDFSGLEFVLNQTTAVSGAALTTVFIRWQRDEAAVLNNARQHHEELANEATRRNGGGRGRGVIPTLPRSNDVDTGSRWLFSGSALFLGLRVGVSDAVC